MQDWKNYDIYDAVDTVNEYLNKRETLGMVELSCKKDNELIDLIERCKKTYLLIYDKESV